MGCHTHQARERVRRKKEGCDMGLTLDEMETHITFVRSEKHAVIYTDDPTTMTRLDKLVERSPDMWSVADVDRLDGRVFSKTYRCEDKSLVSFRAAKVKLNLTEEQRAANAERLRTFRNMTFSEVRDGD